jgi:LysR family glycine cleavage system transcriptional activator
LAADELGVTPAAVSHQVKALEDLLNEPLFYRLTRALRLTDAGQAALPELTEGFVRLVEGVNQIRNFRDDGLLTISVSPSFGAIWLVPKLDRFRSAHTDIEIRIDGTDRLVDVSRGDADVAVRYGPGGYRGAHVDFLFGQRNTAVCSPALLEGDCPLRHPSDLRNHTLLHVAWKDADASWRMWLLAAGIEDINPTKGPLFTEESMAVQAALDGQGVALIGDKLVADHLSAGRLVCPFQDAVRTPLKFSYYLLSAKSGAVPSKVTAFRNWLMNEAQK